MGLSEGSVGERLGSSIYPWQRDGEWRGCAIIISLLVMFNLMFPFFRTAIHPKWQKENKINDNQNDDSNGRQPHTRPTRPNRLKWISIAGGPWRCSRCMFWWLAEQSSPNPIWTERNDGRPIKGPFGTITLPRKVIMFGFAKTIERICGKLLHFRVDYKSTFQWKARWARCSHWQLKITFINNHHRCRQIWAGTWPQDIRSHFHYLFSVGINYTQNNKNCVPNPRPLRRIGTSNGIHIFAAFLAMWARMIFYVHINCTYSSGMHHVSCLRSSALCRNFVLFSRNKLWRVEYLLQFNKPWNETKWIDFWRTFAVFVADAAAAIAAAVADAQKFHLIKPIMVGEKNILRVRRKVFFYYFCASRCFSSSLVVGA